MRNKRKYGLFILVCTLFGSTFLAISLGLKAGGFSPVLCCPEVYDGWGASPHRSSFCQKKASLATIRPLTVRGILFLLFYDRRKLWMYVYCPDPGRFRIHGQV